MKRRRLAAFFVVLVATVPLGAASPLGCGNETFGTGAADGGLDGTRQDRDALPDAAAIPCPPGKGDCDGNASNGCETDLTSMAHCGTCERDCEGSACTAGFCAPAFVASFQSSPTVIGADATGVYWVNFPAGYDGFLLGVLHDGGSPAPGASSVDGGGFVLAKKFVAPSALALSASTVYVADPWGSPSTAGTVFAVVKTTPCNADRAATTCPELSGNQEHNPYDVAVDAVGNVLWTNFGASVTDGGSVSISRGGGLGSALFQSTEGPRGIAVYGKHVYWTARGINASPKVNVVARRVINDSDCVPPHAGCPPEVLFDALGGEVGDVAVDATGIYVTNLTLGTVSWGPLNGSSVGPPTTLAGNQARITSIVMDDRDLYWMQGCSGLGAADGAVSTMPKTGCAAADATCVRVVRGGLACPGGLALDAKHLYFTTSGDGTVWKFVK